MVCSGFAVPCPQSMEGESKEGDKEVEDKKAVRAQYLMEKYATRWQQKMWKLPAVHLRLVQSTWLQQAMFSRSSLSARQTATKIIEDISQVPARKKEIIDMLTGWVYNGDDNFGFFFFFFLMFALECIFWACIWVRLFQ